MKKTEYINLKFKPGDRVELEYFGWKRKIKKLTANIVALKPFKIAVEGKEISYKAIKTIRKSKTPDPQLKIFKV